MTLLETLAIEAKVSETLPQEEQEEQIRLENGWQWAPRSWVIKGDVKEMLGLIDKHTLKFVSEPPKDARIITSKFRENFQRRWREVEACIARHREVQAGRW